MLRARTRIPLLKAAERICAKLRALSPGSYRLGWAVALTALLGLPALRAAEAILVSDQGFGLPFTRFYPFEEIGNVSRGVRLGFDPLGRITVTRGGSCI